MRLPNDTFGSTFDFDGAFECLSGHRPFPWQRRLFRLLCGGTIPSAVDVPTGLGKTAVMACWLLARAQGSRLPRRLIYVVDRRVVVDQATQFAEAIRDGLDRLPQVRSSLGLRTGRLPISTLRGRHADNQEWLEDPAATAIIVGTVDMIGSRLLFSGYGMSRKMWPNAAGLLGCDSLVVLDEAHLARPFERLLVAIRKKREVDEDRDPTSFPSRRSETSGCVRVPPPFCVLPLSATLSSPDVGLPPSQLDGEDRFQLDDDDRSHEIVNARLTARKTLRVTDLAEGSNLDDALANAAWDLYLDESVAAQCPIRLLVYSNSRDVAEKVAIKLKARAKEESTTTKTILFTGGRRVFERQQAADELQECSLIGGTGTPPTASVFLVATSAGEVGVDLDADHMVCDLVPWERMVQRLGRVNRRGTGAARVQVIDAGKSSNEAELVRHQNVRKLLAMLPRVDGDGRQAGPGALIDLGEVLGQNSLIAQASTPTPLYPEVSKELVEAWAMTSLPEHTGRPEVGPWLRGWVDDEPQTTVAWRGFLPLGFQNGSQREVQSDHVEAFFDAAPLQVSELLESEAWRVADWLKKRVRKVARSLAKKQSGESQAPVSEADHERPSRLDENSVVALLFDSAGKLKEYFSLEALTEIPAKAMNRKLVGSKLVVDARLGGIQDGLLDAGCDEEAYTLEGGVESPEIEAAEAQTVRIRLLSAESRGSSPSGDDPWQEALALPYKVTPEEDVRVWLVAEKKVGSATSEDSRAVAPSPQKLREHQARVATEAATIARALDLETDDRAMLVAAAAVHDDGKNASRWQRAFNAPTVGGPYAKTPGPLNLQVLNGYRHEFQSVLCAERNGLEGVHRSSPRFDLALHLIATHHGNARPVIGTQGCDSLPPTVAARHALEIAQRFARLQKRWGPWGLAWWEALLRAADRRASKEHDEESKERQRTLGAQSSGRPAGNSVASLDANKKGGT